jgi:hypothetical protein
MLSITSRLSRHLALLKECRDKSRPALITNDNEFMSPAQNGRLDPVDGVSQSPHNFFGDSTCPRLEYVLRHHYSDVSG